ncbi:MAG: hypothetical protein ACXWUG_11055 [Polyangiales bacterium]
MTNEDGRESTIEVTDDDLVLEEIEMTIEMVETRARDIHAALRASPTKRIDPLQYREAIEEARLAERSLE